MRNSRPLLWILGGVAVAGALGWLVLAPGSSDRAAPADGRRDEAQAPAAQHEPAPALPADPAPRQEDDPEHLEHHDDVGADELSDDLPELPAPPDEGDIAARPERQPITPEQQRAQRQASIDLLDRHITRLEAEQKAAEASGDTRTADRNRIRVERMRQRRATLEAEAARP